MRQHSQQLEGINLPENPQEDGTEDVPPWESQDPDIRKFYEDSEENRLLDRIIKREIEQIEKEREKRKNKRKQTQFSEFYNFMFTLTKRLKMRMNENKKPYKFRQKLTS